MAEMYAVKGDDLTAIADAIRLKNDSSAPIEIPEMANMIRMIEGGGLPASIAEFHHEVFSPETATNDDVAINFDFAAEPDLMMCIPDNFELAARSFYGCIFAKWRSGDKSIVGHQRYIGFNSFASVVAAGDSLPSEWTNQRIVFSPYNYGGTKLWFQPGYNYHFFVLRFDT